MEGGRGKGEERRKARKGSQGQEGGRGREERSAAQGLPTDSQSTLLKTTAEKTISVNNVY